MKYQINSTGHCILADQAFVDAVHPGDYTLLPDLPDDPKQAQREAILEQLSEIDAQSDTPRMRREIRLGVQAGAARLAGLEAQAVALRMQLTNLG